MADDKDSKNTEDKTDKKSVDDSVKDSGDKSGDKKDTSNPLAGLTDEQLADVDKYVQKKLSAADRKWKADQEEKEAAANAKREREKLEDEGKYKELLEAEKAEKERLAKKLEHQEFEKESTKALKEEGLLEFGEFLLEPPDKLEDVVERAKSIRKMIDERVKVEVLKRLETGEETVKGDTSKQSQVSKLSELNTVDKKLAYIKEFGQEAYEKLCVKAAEDTAV